MASLILTSTLAEAVLQVCHSDEEPPGSSEDAAEKGERDCLVGAPGSEERGLCFPRWRPPSQERAPFLLLPCLLLPQSLKSSTRGDQEKGLEEWDVRWEWGRAGPGTTDPAIGQKKALGCAQRGLVFTASGGVEGTL